MATVLPENATDKTVTWQSDKPAIASVVNGKITALSLGTATITATAGEKTASCLVTVLPITVDNITLSEPALTLYVGDEQTLVATVLPENATDKTVTWQSDKPTIASVVNGKVTALSLGTATITATAGEKTATCPVTVKYGGVLINGVRWSEYNVDAVGTFADAPEAAGKFYRWNSKVAWAATGSVSGWDTTLPTVDTWAAENDPSPEGWRVPTRAELESLLNTEYVSNQWTTVNGVDGRRFTDLTTGASIFLPAAGYRNSAGEWSSVMHIYWSSTTTGGNPNNYIIFNISNNNYAASLFPLGAPVRPVKK